MIIEIRAKNCFAFENRVIFSMKADMRNKKFVSNVHKENNFNILKTAGIYGFNNAGKTCLIKCIRALKQILSNDRPFSLQRNIFTNNKICELGITFLQSGRKFSCDFKYDREEKEFSYEKFAEIFKDRYGYEKEVIWLERDFEHNKHFCIDSAVNKIIPLLAKNNLLCYLIDTGRCEHLSEMKKLFQEFTEKIDILDMNRPSVENTIELLKQGGQGRKKIVDFMKNADIYLEDFKYVDFNGETSLADDNKMRRSKISELLREQMRLFSTYKGRSVPSMLFDSVGTKKLEALAGYIIEGLEQGRILVVDELDSSMHFKLTRAIVAMFNNELNTDAQLIFTTHDVNLLDCKRLFRKEQIWFVNKDNEGVYVYSLAEFTAKKGVRDTTDIIEKYRKGILGVLPEPDFVRSLLKIKGKKVNSVASK